MPPAESSLDSLKRSLLPEKVSWRNLVGVRKQQPHSESKDPVSFVLFGHSIVLRKKHLILHYVWSLKALATLKPQAGLVAPQAVPASQPAAAVSD